MQKLTKDAIKKLRAVKRQILAHPRRFNIDKVIEKTSCGTVACIAGWLILNETPEAKRHSNLYAWFTSGEKYNVPKLACEILGVAPDKSEHGIESLFYINGWPEPFKAKHNSAKTLTAKSRVAAEYIEYFIKQHS